MYRWGFRPQPNTLTGAFFFSPSLALEYAVRDSGWYAAFAENFEEAMNTFSSNDKSYSPNLRDYIMNDVNFRNATIEYNGVSYGPNPCLVKGCGKSDNEKAMVFRGTRWCSEMHRKIITGEVESDHDVEYLYGDWFSVVEGDTNVVYVFSATTGSWVRSPLFMEMFASDLVGSIEHMVAVPKWWHSDKEKKIENPQKKYEPGDWFGITVGGRVETWEYHYDIDDNKEYWRTVPYGHILKERQGHRQVEIPEGWSDANLWKSE